MSLWTDFKALSLPMRITVIGATLAGLASAGYGAKVLWSGKPLEERVSVEETYKPGENEQGKPTYTFKTSDNQREGYKVAFEDEKAFKRFNDFVSNYTVDHEQALEGRDYLTPAEAWQLVKLVDDKNRPENKHVITARELDDAESGYHANKDNFKITFDIAPREPGKAFDLATEAERQYGKLEADQDRYLAMCRERIGTRQEKVHKLWNAAEAHYQRDLRANVPYQRAKAEFNHYKK